MGKHFDKEKDSLRRKVLHLSAMVESSVDNAVRSVNQRNSELAQSVIQGDREIDRLEVDIEEDCLKILALHQPVAVDLRYVVSMLKMDNDLERIGDLAVNIAERALFLCDQAPMETVFDLTQMAGKVKDMLRGALDALIHFDSRVARKVCLADDEVDEMNREMYTIIFKRVRENPEQVEQLMQFLSVSRHLERIGDYATNIAEDVIYMVEGEIVRHRPDATNMAPSH